MSFADSLKPILYGARAFAGQLGFRPHAVEILTGAWSGAHTGDGTETATALPIAESGGQPPKTRWLNDEQIALGGLPRGTVEIGPITPSFPGGGTLLATLAGDALVRGETIHVRITGPKHPSGALYRLTSLTADKALSYKLQAQPVATA